MTYRGHADSPLPRGLSVVIPVYNAAGTLPELMARLRKVLDELTSYEVVMIDDGSHDESWPVIQRLVGEYPWLRGIRLMRNFGQHNALFCGILEARYNVIVTMDDDLQNPPEEIHHLLAKLDEGYDVVYGIPEKQQQGFLRDLASWMTKLALQSIIGVETARQVNAFRAFRTRLRQVFANYRSPTISIDVLLTWGTVNFGAVKVRHDPRLVGKSNYTFWQLVNHALNMMAGFSTLPLRLASWIGFFFTAFGVALFAYLMVNYMIYQGSVQGFSFIASTIVIFSGAQLFTLGIIGEYLARIYWRTMDRPPFSIFEIVQDDER